MEEYHHHKNDGYEIDYKYIIGRNGAEYRDIINDEQQHENVNPKEYKNHQGTGFLIPFFGIQFADLR